MDEDGLGHGRHRSPAPLSSALVPGSCVHPAGAQYKWIALVFMCILCFGSYYCYDNPAALQDTFLTSLKMTNAQYAMLYSIYSWPNVILPFFGGYLIDNVLGIKFSAVLFAAVIMIGQIVFASGALIDSFPLMIFGRLLFALAGENLGVCQNAYTVQWFKGNGNELNTVFGIQLSFSRLGSTINLYVMKPLLDWVSDRFEVTGSTALGITLLIGSISTIVSFGSSLVLYRMTRRNDQYKKSRLLHNSHSSLTPAPAVTDSTDLTRHADSVADNPPIRLLNVSKFPLSFWLLCAICVCYYVAVFPLVGFGLVLFENKFGLSPYPWSEVCNSLIYFISIVACAPAGMMVDRFGRNTYWILLAVVLTIAGHSLLAFTFITPYVGMSVLGVSLSILAASLWPCVAFIVPNEMTGTAYGVMQSVQNLGLAVFFWTAGLVLDARGYFALELYFIAFLTVALAATIVLIIVDQYSDGPLSKSSEVRNNTGYSTI